MKSFVSPAGCRMPWQDGLVSQDGRGWLTAMFYDLFTRLSACLHQYFPNDHSSVFLIIPSLKEPHLRAPSRPTGSPTHYGTALSECGHLHKDPKRWRDSGPTVAPLWLESKGNRQVGQPERCFIAKTSAERFTEALVSLTGLTLRLSIC